MWGERGERRVVAYHLTEFIDVVQFIQRHQLDADIAKRGGFNGAGHYRQAAGIGAQLVKQRVLAAAADDMQLAERVAAECRQFVQYPGIQQRQAVKNAARQFGGSDRDRLGGLRAGGLNFGAHIGRVDKAIVIAINQITTGR